MSRSQSSFRMLSAALGLAICAAVAPAFSQVPVSNANFSITFPAGWMNLPFLPNTDSSAMLFDTTTEASVFLFAAPHVGTLTTAEIIAAMRNLESTDSLEVVAEGTKTLGGKSFSYIDWKKAGATGAQDIERYRVYFHTTGTFMFEGILGFDKDQMTDAVGDMETALATLNLTGGSAIRRAAYAALRPASVRADRDVLGRQARLPSGKRLPQTLYRAN